MALCGAPVISEWGTTNTLDVKHRADDELFDKNFGEKIPTSQPSIETVSLSQESEPARDSIEEYLTYLISHLNLRRGNKLEETFNLFYSNTF